MKNKFTIIKRNDEGMSASEIENSIIINDEIFFQKNYDTYSKIDGNTELPYIQNISMYVKNHKNYKKFKIKLTSKENVVLFLIHSYEGEVNFPPKESFKIKAPEESDKRYSFVKTEEYILSIKKILSKTKIPKPITNNDWINFIDDYITYADYKASLLKEDFYFFGKFNIERNVLKISNKNNAELFKKYKDKQDVILDKSSHSREKYIYLDFDIYKELVNNWEQKKLKEQMAIKELEYPITSLKEAVSFSNKWKSKLMFPRKQLSFYNTNKIYNENDIEKNSENILREDRISVSYFNISDPITHESLYYYDLNDFNSNLNKIKKFAKNEIVIESLEDLIKFKDKCISIENLLLNSLRDIKSEIRNSLQKKDYMDVEDIIKVNELLDLSNKIIIDKVSFEKYEKYILEWKNEIEKIEKANANSQVKLILEKDEKINNKKNDLSNYNFLLNGNDNSNIEKNSEKKISIKSGIELNIISEIEKEFKIKKADLEKNKIKNLNKINAAFSSGAQSTIRIPKLEKYISELETLKNELNDLEIKIKSIIITMKFYFKFLEKDNLKLNNVFVLNSGDFTLVKTIKIINNKIKNNYKKMSIVKKIVGSEQILEYVEDKTKDEKIIECNPNFEKLNPSQKAAFRLSIDETDPISIIHGPPGTGKTKVITELIRYFNYVGKSVILSSNTNVAISNVLDKLDDIESDDSELMSIWISSNENNHNESIDELNMNWYKIFEKYLNINSNKYDFISKLIENDSKFQKEDKIVNNFNPLLNAKVVAATTTTSKVKNKNSLVNNAKILIIDEVSKSILPEILRYVENIEKIVLVGDYKQLNPIFNIQYKKLPPKFEKDKFEKVKKTIESGIFLSLSERAKTKNRIVTLNTNYRSLPGVIDTYNVFYSGENGEGLLATRNINELSENYIFSDSARFFNKNYSLYVRDVHDGKQEFPNGNDGSRINRKEIYELIEIMKTMKNEIINLEDKKVAIIFPYSLQIKEFNKEMKKTENSELNNFYKNISVIDTVDSFQGSEADIVLISMVVTEPNRNFLSEFRRINVAVSRAKDILVIVCKKNVLENIIIEGEGIVPEHYFRTIFNRKENKYLKIK